MAEKEADFAWQAPPKEAKSGAKMAWLNDVISAGEQIAQTKTGYRDMRQAIDMIDGRSADKVSESRSRLSINRGKRALREVVANIADIRAIDGYTTDNAALKDFIAMQNKVWKAVYFESKFPRAMKRCTQWLAAGGIAYISPVYRNLRLNAKSAKAIDFDVFSRADVLPFQMPDSNNIQGAYGVTMMRFMPLFEGQGKFPKFQQDLRPIAKRRYSGDAAKDRLRLAERFRMGDNAENASWTEQNYEFRYTYLRDLSINEGKKPRPMGPPGALESYIVPFVGQELPTPDMNNGVRVMRKAIEEDCYLYPNLRLFISQKGMKEELYDGPAFDWHGMFPLARFSADEWPWEEGYSLARDIFSVEETRANVERGMDQTTKARFDPSMIYDINAGIPRKTMEGFDPYKERGRMGVDGPIDEKMMRTALPEKLLNIESWAFEWLKHLDDSADYMLGLNAMQNLAKAKMGAASGDALQQAQESNGPIVADVSHAMEMPMQDLLEMVMYDVLQYYPAGRIMQYVGADGVSREVFDLDPTSLVPSHTPQEDPKNGPSIYTRMERTKQFCGNVHTLISPGSLHSIVQTQQQLLYMQLQRAGFMISSETVANAMNIPNFGTFGGNTEIDRWQNEQKVKIQFAEKLKELAGSFAGAAPGGPPAAGGGKAKPGRPPSGNKPPEMKTKGSAEGPRATITES